MTLKLHRNTSNEILWKVKKFHRPSDYRFWVILIVYVQKMTYFILAKNINFWRFYSRFRNGNWTNFVFKKCKNVKKNGAKNAKKLSSFSKMVRLSPKLVKLKFSNKWNFSREDFLNFWVFPIFLAQNGGNFTKKCHFSRLFKTKTQISQKLCKIMEKPFLHILWNIF